MMKLQALGQKGQNLRNLEGSMTDSEICEDEGPSGWDGCSDIVPSPTAAQTNAAYFEMCEGGDLSTRSNTCENDLEFAYDWGLNVASRMSIRRALELAKWASDKCFFPDSDGFYDDHLKELNFDAGGIKSDETMFEAPLADLQAALDILQRGQDESSGVANDTPDFSKPVAVLQNALDRLKATKKDQPSPSKATCIQHSPSPSKVLDFEAPLMELENVLAHLKGVSTYEHET